MVRRVLYYDAVDGHFKMAELRELDRIADNEEDDMRAQWLEAEAARIKRENRERAVNRALGVACLVAAGVLR